MNMIKRTAIAASALIALIAASLGTGSSGAQAGGWKKYHKYGGGYHHYHNGYKYGYRNYKFKRGYKHKFKRGFNRHFKRNFKRNFKHKFRRNFRR